MYSSLGATATWNLFHEKLETSEKFAEGPAVENIGAHDAYSVGTSIMSDDMSDTRLA